MNKQSTTTNFKDEEQTWSEMYEDMIKLNWEPIVDRQPEDVDPDHPINQWFKETFEKQKQEENTEVEQPDKRLDKEALEPTDRYYQYGDDKRSADYDNINVFKPSLFITISTVK